ncbi:MAG: exodeoxyribonuclease VII small subunit [Gammaproteobacteria bacterium]|nr:exodeoxyribonuclease VII small subunit [Gammaproteobacteria bacterium]
MSKKSKEPVEVNFEASLAELETLIEHMEAGDLTLEESLKAFERGVSLTRDCQAALKRAELRVQALTQTSDGLALEDLDAEDIDPADAD